MSSLCLYTMSKFATEIKVGLLRKEDVMRKEVEVKATTENKLDTANLQYWNTNNKLFLAME